MANYHVFLLTLPISAHILHILVIKIYELESSVLTLHLTRYSIYHT